MKKIIVFLLCLTMGINLLFAQDIERNIKERLTDYFAKYTATAKISTPKLNSFDIDYDRRTIHRMKERFWKQYRGSPVFRGVIR